MVSVVIPLYNKEKYIKQTLESVLNQTFQDFEIVVVDDGSKDGSADIVKAIDSPKIRLISKKNEGASVARNLGMMEARGELIAFLDADDFWKENYLKEMVDFSRKYPEAGMYSCAHEVLYERKVVNKCTDLPEGYVENYFKLMLSYPVTWTSATMIKKEVYYEVGGFPVGMVGGQDSYMWTKVALKYPVAFNPQVLASYNYVGNGLSRRDGKLDTCKESWYDFYDPNNFYLNEYIARKALFVGRRYIIGFHYSESKKIEELYSYNKLSRKQWRTLRTLNRSPKIAVKFYFWLDNLKKSLS